MMFFEVKVRKNGKEVWVDARKFFEYMLNEYSKVKYEGKSIEPYPDRVNKFYDNIPRKLISEWKDAYPNVDIEAECKKAKMWLLSNTIKPKKLFKSFTNNWLSRAMQNGGVIPVNVEKRVELEIKKHKEYMEQAEVDVASDEDRKEIIQGVMSKLKWKKKTI